jgi:lycopene beta-cyclase
MDNNSHSNQEGIYDIIIAGAGCAGLSLLYSILNAPTLQHKKILVIDKSFEKSNDRTWCFWQQEVGIFESLVCKQWEQISVHKNEFSTILPTAPFTYKMIEGLDFYKHVLNFAKQFSNVHWQEASITSMETAGLPQKDARQTNAIVYWEGGFAKGHKVFSSILPLDDLYAISQGKQSAPFLWQHFKGHLVEFEDTVFDQNVARLMDFNVDQKGATGFMYVLPLTDRKALVEYTLFSKSLLKPEDYVLEINSYIQGHYPNKEYKIIHEEIGAIPMTTQSFAKSSTPIYVIGTLGNAVKSSTGYAFHFIQQQVKQIVKSLINGKKVDTEIHNTRHQFYDSVLLHILSNNLMEGSEIFKRIFEKNKAATIFKFLSNTSTIWEDISIMRSLPTRIFLPAAIKVLFRRG